MRESDAEHGKPGEGLPGTGRGLERPRASEEAGPPRPDDAGQERLDVIARRRRVRVAKVGVALAFAVLLIVFIIANSQPVVVDFVFTTRRPRLIWVMLACAVLGGMIGYLIGRPGRDEQAGGSHDATDRGPARARRRRPSR